jgi:hypothetical protein
MSQIHKRFSDDQVRAFFQSYCQGSLSRKDIQEVLELCNRVCGKKCRLRRAYAHKAWMRCWAIMQTFNDDNYFSTHSLLQHYHAINKPTCSHILYFCSIDVVIDTLT